jgi:hypothetical protein
MDVLHHSFSLSACPKCHRLVCKHTSLADLDFRPTEPEHDSSATQPNHLTSIRSAASTSKTPYPRLSSHGMNFYILPLATADHHYSWTTFGTDSIETSHILDTISIDDETLCDDIPFADENIIRSCASLKSPLNQIVRTQSERCPKNFRPHFYLTKSFSFSTIYTAPKSSTTSPRQQSDEQSSNKCSWNPSQWTLVLLILSYLLTNTFDIVLLYIYYHTNSLYFIIFVFILLTCDIVLWINNVIEFKSLSTRFLLVPFVLRVYLLYGLVELLLPVVHRNSNDRTHILDSSSTPSSSTSTTLETNRSHTIDSSFIHAEHQTHSCKTIKRPLLHYLTVFYLIHSSLLTFINLYFWTNNFQPSSQSLLNMDYFVPRWTTDDGHLFSPTTITVLPLRSSSMA